MKSKLTLTIEESIITKAECFAKNKGISLSELVENHLESITQDKSDEKISVKVKEISGEVGTRKTSDEPIEFRYSLEKKNLGNYSWIKIILTLVCFGISIIGFMMKLPSVFRHYDKEMHTLFYFMTAAFLNFLFAERKFIKHVVIFIFLAFFGVAIEYAQEYSNKFFHNRIHGHYDIEDIKYNLYGLIIFSIIWIMYTIIVLGYGKLNKQAEK